MANPSKRKGTSFENAVVQCLRDYGFLAAERRALHGTQDRGDIVNGPSDFTIEAKAAKKYDLAGWLDQADREAQASFDAGDGYRWPVVWVKAQGKASAADGYVVMRGDVFAALCEHLEGDT